jgi:hypothetical protein
VVNWCIPCVTRCIDASFMIESHRIRSRLLCTDDYMVTRRKMGIWVSIERDNKRKIVCAHYETMLASSKTELSLCFSLSTAESFRYVYGLVPVVDVVAKLVSCKTLLVILMPG